MKYFISKKDGPMVKSLGLEDSDTKYIGIIDSLVAEMSDKEVASLKSQGFEVEPDEEFFIPPPIFSPHLQYTKYYPSEELDPLSLTKMKQMETSGVEKLRELGYLGSDTVHVGIADSGVDGTHYDLTGNLKYFRDFVDTKNTTPIDPAGHGCIAPYDKIYNSKYGLQDIESFYNLVDMPEVQDTFSLIKHISHLDINTISYDIENLKPTVNKVLAIHKLKHEGDIYKVKTEYDEELTLTPWHPVYIYENKGVKKQKAEDLRHGDFILASGYGKDSLNDELQKIPFKSEYICKDCWTVFSDKITKCDVCGYIGDFEEKVNYIDLDDRLAFLCGLIFANGCISKHNKTVSFYSKNLGTIKAFEGMVSSLFDINCKRKIENNNIKSYFNNSDVAKMLISICNFSKKKFPKQISLSPRDIIMYFVAGITEENGDISNKNIKIISYSKKFASDLVYIMKFLGIPASYSNEFDNCYQIKIRARHDIISKLFKNNVQFKPGIREFSKIVSIEKVKYNGYMYDLTVDNSHVYAANGLIVSNTACASIMLGKGIKVEKFHGVAPRTKFSMARVMDAKGSGSESTILQGVDWLVETGVSIINLSLGSWLTRYTPFSKAVDNIVDKGITVFVAAGNDGPKQITSPANAVNAITCAACNKDGEYADFSSLGPAKGPDKLSLDKPDIMAWGKDVALARSKGTCMGSEINDDYVYASGTSFATPFMAGCGALLKSINPNLTPAEIKQLLVSTAYDSDKYDKYHEGFGNVKIYDAVNKLLDGKLGGSKESPKISNNRGCLTSLLFIK